MATLKNVPENQRREDSHQDQYASMLRGENEGWLHKDLFVLALLAVFILSTTLLAVTNPPGGFWKRNGVLPDNTEYEAGKSRLAYIWPEAFLWFVRLSSAAFYGSAGIIMLLTSGSIFLMRKTFVWTIVIVWITISLVSVTYTASLRVLVSHEDIGNHKNGMLSSVLSILLILGLLMLLVPGHVWRKITGARTDNPTTGA